MRLKFILCVLIGLPVCFTTAQTTRRQFSAFSAGSGAYSLNYENVFSFTTNQASLAQLKKISAGIYTERRFLLEELSLCTFAFALPTSSGNFGLSGSYYGFSQYNEIQTGLAYARKFGSKVDAGLQFDYSSIRIAGYGKANAINFELGMILHLSDRLNAALHAYNPVGGRFLKNGQEKLASVYTIGLGYDASEFFFAGAEIEKEEDRPVNVNVGVKYRFLPQLIAKAGIATATSGIYLGVGYSLGAFYFDITVGYHPQLGTTPGLLMIYNSNPANTPVVKSN